MRVIAPDKNSLRIIETILAQNAQIIETNARLLEHLANPAVLVDQEIKVTRPGEVVHKG